MTCTSLVIPPGFGVDSEKKCLSTRHTTWRFIAAHLHATGARKGRRL